MLKNNKDMESSMSILMFEQIKKNLAEDIKNAQSSISIISAFCKKQSL